LTEKSKFPKLKTIQACLVFFFVKLNTIHYLPRYKQYFAWLATIVFQMANLFLYGDKKPWFLNLKSQDTNFLTDADTPIQTSISKEKRDVDTPIQTCIQTVDCVFPRDALPVQWFLY
jgi:hypothetical protein